MENNIDFAEMLLEVAEQAIKDCGGSANVTWYSLKEQLQKYIAAEEYEIKLLRKYKVHPDDDLDTGGGESNIR